MIRPQNLQNWTAADNFFWHFIFPKNWFLKFGKKSCHFLNWANLLLKKLSKGTSKCDEITIFSCYSFEENWCSGYHYYTTSFNKAWTKVLCMFKSCSQHAGYLQWWESLTIVPAGHKAQYISSVDHCPKTIYNPFFQNKVLYDLRITLFSIRVNVYYWWLWQCFKVDIQFFSKE